MDWINIWNWLVDLERSYIPMVFITLALCQLLLLSYSKIEGIDRSEFDISTGGVIFLILFWFIGFPLLVGLSFYLFVKWIIKL